MSTTPNVNVDVDPNIKPVRGYENGLPLRKRNKKGVLCQNENNTYCFVNEDWINTETAEGRAPKLVQIHPHDADYISGMKLALGKADGFKPGEMIQIGGEAFRADEIGRVDADAILKQAEKDVAEYADRKEKGLLITSEMPKDMSTFAGKAQRDRLGKRR